MSSKVGLISPPDTDTPGLRDGRACRHCAQVKERCIPYQGGSNGVPVCRRCHRLNKKCSTPAPVARKKPRLDSPVSQSATPASAPTPYIAASQSADAAAASAVATRLLVPLSQTLSNATQQSQQPVSATLEALGHDFKQKLLEHFRDEMAQNFPFLAHSPLIRGRDESTSTNVVSCEQKAPFAFAAVCMCALHRHCLLQKRASQELLASLASAMLLQGRKSLDLLYCLLIVEAWYPFHVVRNPQMSNLLGLARALIVDLGLSLGAEGLPLRLWPDASQILFGRNTGPQDFGAECRAILGTYYIGAYYAVTLRRSDFPNWHESIEHGCRYLETKSTSDADIKALHSIRLLQLAEPFLVPRGIRPTSTMTVRTYISCFQPALQTFRTTLPASLATDTNFHLDISCIELALYDRIIPCTPTHPTETVEALHTLLTLVTSYLDAINSIPPEEFPARTSLSNVQISQALEILAKLSTPSGIPGWDAQYVRTHHGFPAACDRLVDKFEEVYLAEKERFPDMEASQFAIYPIKMRQRKRWYEEAVAKEVRECEDDSGAAATAVSTAEMGASMEGGVGSGGGGGGGAQLLGGAAEFVNGMSGVGWEAFDDFLQYPMEEFTWP